MKQDKKKETKENIENRNWQTTDYKIPKFSYKSALLIVGLTFLLTALTIWLTNGSKPWIVGVTSLTLAATTAYSQYFIDQKKGYTKGFFLTFFGLLAGSVAVMMFLNF